MDDFADLLKGAFSESSASSFSDGELDFESLSVDEKREEDKMESLTTKTDEALLQEAADESVVTTDTLLVAENQESASDESDEEDTSSEEEGSSSGDVEENVGALEEPEGLLMSVCCSDDLYDAQNEEEIFAEGPAMASEGTDNPKDSNKVQGEAERDEEASYFGGIPERGDETMMIEREREESSDSDSEDMTTEQEENIPLQETDNSYKISSTVKDNLAFQGLSLENLQNLITEVDGEKYAEKMTDFTGDEHQEAGETIADYPSDFSSGEYAGAELNASPPVKQEQGAVTEAPWIGGTEDSGCEKDDGFLYSADLEMNTEKVVNVDVAAGEHEGPSLAVMGDRSSYSSSDDEEPLRGTREEPSDDMNVRDVDNVKLEDVQLCEFSRWSGSDDQTIKDRSDPADFIRSGFDMLKTKNFLSEHLLTTEGIDETEDLPSDENQCPAEDVNCYSVVQRATASPWSQGSIDDGFLFNVGSSEVSETLQLANDNKEEKTNSEQMQERIEAFKRFYDNSDDKDGKGERQIKVQFCADPLSQVNYYETDSSDRDSLSSSTDMEDDLSSEELKKPEDILETIPICETPKLELPQSVPEVRDTQTCTKACKGGSKLKLMLNLGVVMMTGLLMFWLVTDKPDWLRDLFSV